MRNMIDQLKIKLGQHTCTKTPLGESAAKLSRLLAAQLPIKSAVLIHGTIHSVPFGNGIVVSEILPNSNV